MPYAVIGKIFGWNYYTPIFYNMVAWTVAFVLFAILLYDWIDLRNLAWLFATFACYGIGLRYVFSMTPESLTAAILLIYCALAFRLHKKYEDWVLICACVVICILTLMRGYYAAFGLVVAAILFKNKKYYICIATLAVLFLSAIAFVVINHFFTAPYFSDIVNYASLLSPRYFLHLIKEGIYETWGYIVLAIQRESMRGSWYIMYLIVGVFLVLWSWKEKSTMSFTLVLVWGILLIAMWVLYNPKEGSRQLMNCALVGLLMIMAFSKKWFPKVLVLICLVFCTYLSKDTFFGTVPVSNDNHMASISSAHLEENMPISENPWNNTIAMSLSMDFRDMYAAPSGFGLNFCFDEYLIENFDSMEVKYVAVAQGSEVDRLLDEKNCSLIDTFGSTNIYAIR